MAEQRTANLLPLAALSALLLGLAAFIFWLNSNDRNHASLSTLLEPDTVRKIEIRPAALTATIGEEKITRLQRDANGWTLSRPLASANGTTRSEAVPANADRVAPLLGLLHLPQRDNYHIDEIELADVGLMPPQVSVEIDDIEFLFGDKTLDGNARYVRIDDRVHLYQDFIFPLLTAGPDVFAASAN